MRLRTNQLSLHIGLKLRTAVRAQKVREPPPGIRAALRKSESDCISRTKRTCARPCVPTGGRKRELHAPAVQPFHRTQIIRRVSDCVNHMKGPITHCFDQSRLIALLPARHDRQLPFMRTLAVRLAVRSRPTGCELDIEDPIKHIYSLNRMSRSLLPARVVSGTLRYRDRLT